MSYKRKRPDLDSEFAEFENLIGSLTSSSKEDEKKKEET